MHGVRPRCEGGALRHCQNLGPAPTGFIDDLQARGDILPHEVHALVGLLVILGAYGRKIPLEERTLRAVFGPAYDSYAHETRALIPFLF
jgi:hypothetical protein